MQYEIDASDASVWGLHAISVLVLVGIATFGLFGYTASQSIMTLSTGITDIGFNAAGIVALSTFAWVYITNERAEIPDDDLYKGIVASGSILVVSLVFLPEFRQFIINVNDFVALIVAILSTAALGVIGYLK